MEKETDQGEDYTLDEEQDAQEEQEITSQSEETTDESSEKPSYEELEGTIRNLQKGYTQTRQELAEIKKGFEKPASGGEQESREVPEPQNFKEAVDIIAEELVQRQQKVAQAREQELNAYEEKIANDLSALETNEIISNDKDAESLIEYTIQKAEKLGIPQENLLPSQVAEDWKRDQEALAAQEARKATDKVKQEEGSKVGTSSKSEAPKGSTGASYEEIHNKSFDQLIE